MINELSQDIERILVTEEEIQDRIKTLGEQISKDYAGKNPLVICILKGAAFFMTDLVRYLTVKCEMDFMDIDSYGDATVSSGQVKIVKDLSTSVDGRNVLIVEDIIDTGRTLHHLKELLALRKAKSVRICTLLDKPERREFGLTPDYIGLEVPNEFVVGYGLDYRQHYRNLPYIGVLKADIYE
ncbi:hypoxanthine phosphoribosyltransferase [Atopobacter sp. AH10]|uniref:hypoxanthine phosphoribosyltransferase n=1 Tax=Atopobacter sp. AH10 TaxID=2315861 RepID=UPI000EF23B2E|nr:hypoxanthine phosphoribosyltransferase [Atopobacter sp. AH10]RLK63616.1 hypoxanthine phosphoribosyltransferase [Atopobacter sp. AH10]